MIKRASSLIFYLAFVVVLISNYAFPDRAKAYSGYHEATAPDSLLLTKQKVKDWMQTRIAVAKLQKQMKNNASAYANLVQEFYAKRAELLDSEGWSVDEFEATKERIHAAISAMDIADELEESKVDHEKEITTIKNSDFYSDEQKQELVHALSKGREQKRIQFIEPTKPDWPAVKPYRSAFHEMTSWIAGNTSTIPVIK